uniref:G-protein coupled receptors family 3 profile domain-containing protein n=1 Tax=Cyprinus carpio carpio TaxID=630221 RepID=A0A9J7XYS7_CYPCA
MAQTMIFAIEEINRSQRLLPNVSVGYRIYDTCGSRLSSMSATMALMNGPEFTAGDRCNGQSPIHAIIGETESSATVILSRTTGPFKIPVVRRFFFFSFSLSDKKDYPSFFRTIASDYHQSRALAYIVKHFGWSWVGAVNSDNDYGNNGMTIFLNTAQEEGICVEYSVKFYRTEPDKLQKVVETIKKSTAKVIVAFLTSSEMYNLLEQLSIQNITGLQMIGVEGWITAKNLITPNSFHVLGGSLGFAVRKNDIEGFADYVIKAFWKTVVPCSQTEGNSSQYAVNCNTYQDLLLLKNYNEDVPEQRYSSNVYKAVYAVVHSLHSLLKCKEQAGCEKGLTIQPQQVNKQTNKQIIEFLYVNTGNLQAISQFQGKLLLFVLSLLRCSSGCSFLAKDLNKIILSLTIMIITFFPDSNNCRQCPGEYWSNAEKNKCVLKAVEFLSFTEIMGIVLVFFSLFGAGLTVLIAILFYSKKDTPIVKANNSELSFLLLFSLVLCFLCSLTFIGRPTEWSCMLRHSAFGITFVLCISCVLGKTIVVLMAFKATLPGSNIMKWFGPAQQRLSVLAFTLIQVLICVLWLKISPPFPYKNLKYYNEKIVLDCSLGSTVGFWAVLGYIGLLAVLCFILAFLARKLPDKFNEAKFITFSMLIFCAVWITFIPSYVSPPGKFTVAVEIFAILASSFGLLCCIFVPKCYIILCKPEQNTKQHLMGKGSI